LALIVSERAEKCSVITQKVDRRLGRSLARLKDRKKGQSREHWLAGGKMKSWLCQSKLLIGPSKSRPA
jgi:hypothetical protein